MFSDDVEDVMDALAGNADVGDVEGLGVRRSVDGQGKQFPELGCVDVLRRESHFGSIEASTPQVVVISW